MTAPYKICRKVDSSKAIEYTERMNMFMSASNDTSFRVPSAEGRALNNSGFFQHNLGPLVPRCALKKYQTFSARNGH